MGIDVRTRACSINATRFRLILSCAVALLWVACSGGGGGGGSVIREVEPNGEETNGQPIRGTAPGTRHRIRGTIINEADVDGFRSTLFGPQTIILTLTHGAGVDFDVVAVDADTDEIYAFCESESSPDSCSFDFFESEADVIFAVGSFVGAGDYQLHIESVG
jgi:hypothetical protein